ncbi:MAG: hypothetical protein KTR30_27840 [Saprospiraceae bacterium]|nr:hypothetical protein [Saprospiraceae bacterium]
MKTISILTLGILLALPSIGFGQAGASYLKIAYEGGQIGHPGLVVGWNKAFHYGEKQKDSGKIISREWRYGAQLGFYHHRRMHTGLLALPQIEWLRTGAKGGQWGFGVSAGYLRTIIPSTFEVIENQVAQTHFRGTQHFVVQPHLRFGGDLSLRRDVPIEWYLQTNLMWQMPHLDGSTQYFLLEAGITYRIP